jgi:anti-sigma factor RsiW
MTPASDKDRCDRMELVSAYVVKALPPDEARALEGHMAACEHCAQELGGRQEPAASSATRLGGA